MVENRSTAVGRSFEFNGSLGATSVFFELSSTKTIISRTDVYT